MKPQIRDSRERAPVWRAAWQTWKDSEPRQHGGHARGRWVGMSYDGVVITGWGALARTQDEARKVVQDLIDDNEVSPA